jgi:uncharacterized protein (DUF1778 family)
MQAVAEAKAKRDNRIEARVTGELKQLFQRAADLEGCTLTDFVIHSAVEAAKRAVREYELIDLTAQDRMAFVEALLNASSAEPTSRFLQAAQRHAQLLQR